MNNNIVKSFLSFFWFLPFLYMFLDIYFVLDYRMPLLMFKLLFFVSLFCVVGLCFADEGFLITRDNAFLYNDKECKSLRFKKPLYKFTFGMVVKKESNNLYVKVIDNILVGSTAHGHSGVGMVDSYNIKVNRFGWIDKNSVILFDYNEYAELYDNATRIFLEKYFP